MEPSTSPPIENPPPPELVVRIRQTANDSSYVLAQHAFERMMERSINPSEIRDTMISGEAIEYNPAGTRGEGDGVLFNGKTSGGRPIHVKVSEVVKPSGNRHIVVTVYEPSVLYWDAEFRIRKSGGK